MVSVPPSATPEKRAEYWAKYSAQHASRNTAEYYEDALSDPTNQKRCCRCSEVKHVSMYCRNRRRPDGFRSECKACQAREKKRGPNEISEATRWAIWERDDFTCRLCQRRRYLVIDHIIPVVRGGGHEKSNLQTLCRSCNASKDAATRRSVRRSSSDAQC